jgi:hypothetical protein
LPLLRRRLTFSRKGVSVQVGKRKLEISTPDDLDDKLIELTGHSAKEVRALLNSWCSPSVVAAALLPFVKDGPSRHELAETIAKAGVNEVRADVRALYDKKAGADGKKAK